VGTSNHQTNAQTYAHRSPAQSKLQSPWTFPRKYGFLAAEILSWPRPGHQNKPTFHADTGELLLFWWPAINRPSHRRTPPHRGTPLSVEGAGGGWVWMCSEQPYANTCVLSPPLQHQSRIPSPLELLEHAPAKIRCALLLLCKDAESMV